MRDARHGPGRRAGAGGEHQGDARLHRALASLEEGPGKGAAAEAGQHEAVGAALAQRIDLHAVGGLKEATGPQLADMGYKAAIDALTYLLASFHFAKQAYAEIKRTGGYSGLTQEQCVAARHEIETLVGLDDFYEIEENTVEEKKWGKR